MLVGVLALQGGYDLHSRVVKGLGHGVREVRDPGDPEGLEAFILPGGESTVMGALAQRRGLVERLGQFLASGRPVLGTCAGAILLAKTITVGGVPSDQWRWGALDVAVERNAYGTQVDSFEVPLEVEGLGPVPGVFIRAPRITALGPEVEVLARFRGDPVLVRQGTVVAATFHPELSGTGALHRWFLAQW